MSDIDNYDSDFDETENRGQNPVRARMKQLEKEAQELRKQVEAANAAQRELAFVKAGVDPTSPMAKYFMKGYDGELNPDAIRQAAVEAQLISPPDATPTQVEAAGWQKVAKIAAGSQTAQPPVDWNQRLAKAESPREVEAILAEARQALQ
jgi:hypothetical protein